MMNNKREGKEMKEGDIISDKITGGRYEIKRVMIDVYYVQSTQCTVEKSRASKDWVIIGDATQESINTERERTLDMILQKSANGIGTVEQIIKDIRADHDKKEEEKG